MGWQDRPYSHEDSPGGRPPMQVRFGRRMTPAAQWLLIANVAVFVIDLLILRRNGIVLAAVAGLNWPQAVAGLELYRFLTYMFVHAGPWHVGLNMLMLYFFAPALERQMGTKRFLVFYFGCGLAGGAVFLAYGWVNALPQLNVIGASGAALGVLVGYAILFPHARLIFILFPIQARTLALIYAGASVLFVLADPRDGGGVAHAAHLGGIVFAWVWLYWLPRWRGTARRVRLKQQEGAFQRRMDREAAEQEEIDAILDKIRAQGLDRLTRAEKKKLKQATDRQREEEIRRSKGRP